MDDTPTITFPLLNEPDAEHLERFLRNVFADLGLFRRGNIRIERAGCTVIVRRYS